MPREESKTLVNRLSSAPFTSLHPEAGPELKLVSASRPSGLHRYLIRPLPVPLSSPAVGALNLVPNDYVQTGDDGCCCSCCL